MVLPTYQIPTTSPFERRASENTDMHIIMTHAAPIQYSTTKMREGTVIAIALEQKDAR